MDNDTYNFCKAVLEKVNSHTTKLEELDKTIESLRATIAELSKPKTRSKKKSVPACACACGHENGCDLDTTVVPAPTTTTLSEPIAPSEDTDLDVPFDGGSSPKGGDPEPADYIDTPIKEFPTWDGKEFPVVRGGIELTPEVISKIIVEFRLGGVDATYHLKYPTDAVDWVLGVGEPARRAIMDRYYPEGYGKPKKKEDK